MKVCLVLERFDPRRGGLEQWTWRFAAGLVEHGHEVHVVAARFGEQTRTMPIVAHRLEGVGPRLAFAEAAQAKLMSLAPEIIHDTGFGWYCDVFHPHGGSWLSVAERKLLLFPPWMRPLKRRLDRMLPRVREFRALLSRQYADNEQVLIRSESGWCTTASIPNASRPSIGPGIARRSAGNWGSGRRR